MQQIYDRRVYTSIVISSSSGTAPVHRDPPEPVYRLRKIQCISQRTWNGLRVWLRQSLAKPEPARPLAPQGGKGGQGARGAPSNIVPQSEKSGQRGLTSSDTKACLMNLLLRRPPPNLTTT